MIYLMNSFWQRFSDKGMAEMWGRFFIGEYFRFCFVFVFSLYLSAYRLSSVQGRFTSVLLVSEKYQ